MADAKVLMMLTAAEISQNYEKTHQFTTELIAKRLRARGYEMDAANEEFTNLCHSVIGSEAVVLLLQSAVFDKTLYQPILESEIDEVRRIFFPDTAKKRFLALDALEADFLSCEPETDVFETDVVVENSDNDMNWLAEKMSVERFEYLQNVLLPRFPQWQENLNRFFAQKNTGKEDEVYLQELNRKIQLLREFYPDGNIQFTAGIDSLKKLSEAEITHIFLNVYLGVERTFPINFLQQDGEARCRVMVRFLVEKILKTTPETVLNAKDEMFFVRHKLQNVYRLFNYSTNRALRNAYPDDILPWLHSRSSARYWEDKNHRIEAIKWLFEEKLTLSPDCFYEKNISKSVFAKHGLSYMFNQHYNSVSKALAEAYPHLQPWEIGKVPYGFWTEENVAEAIRWMVAKKGWQVHELPEKLKSKALNRKTFSEFGLATLFEKRFSKNIYRAISAAWPNYFQPWELGKVASAHWKEEKNIYEAAVWVAEKEGLEKTDIIPAIRNEHFTAKVLSKYSIGNALKKLAKGKLERIFAPLFWQEHKTFLHEHKLMRKISHLKKSEKKSKLLQFLLYGLFMPDIQRNADQNMKRYRRIERRIQNRSIRYFE